MDQVFLVEGVSNGKQLSQFTTLVINLVVIWNLSYYKESYLDL